MSPYVAQSLSAEEDEMKILMRAFNRGITLDSV